MPWVNIGTPLNFLWEGYTLGIVMHSQLSPGTQHIWQFYMPFFSPGCYQPLGAPLVAQVIKNLPAMQQTRVPPLGWENSLEKAMATRSSVLA